MSIRSGPGAAVEIVLPEIEALAEKLHVSPAWLVEEIVKRADIEKLVPAIERAAQKALGPLFA